nr:polysaccharide biosynthesis/export family protein [uncultured Flavobacterium sp.]
MKKLVVLLIAIFFASCASREKMVYLVNNETKSSEMSFVEPVIKADDILQIVISSDNPEISEPYNLRRYNISSNSVSGSGESGTLLMTYLVNTEGFVEMPKLGPVKLGGLTRVEAVNHLKEVLKDYIKNPSVIIRIANYKYSVLGEVNRPGSFSINSERVTIFDAIATAGDLTQYGKRQNIKVIREVEGKTEIEIVDITDNNIMNSPYYYLKQNDVVYVEPNKVKLNSSKFGPSVSSTLSIISLLISTIVIITR